LYIIDFKIYKTQIPVIERAIETATLMLTIQHGFRKTNK